MELIQKLLSDGHYQLALFIGCECYLGLNSENILQIKWGDLTSGHSFKIKDTKTQKVIDLHICNGLKELITCCYQKAGKPENETSCFQGTDEKVLTKGKLRKIFDDIKEDYSLGVGKLSPDSFRVVFGRHILEKYEPRQEMALCVLSQMFNHPNIGYTRSYLGI